MIEVAIPPRRLGAFHGVLPPPDVDGLARALGRLKLVLEGRRIFHVNSTATGGGVAELLSTLLGYEVGVGIDARWLVISAGDGFFEVTKRIHNHLHESPGDSLELDAGARAVYDIALDSELRALSSVVKQGDVAILHDPQTAGLIPGLRALGVDVVWRCHVGVDEPGTLAREAWSFLLGDVEAAQACVFSRRSYVWEGIVPQRVAIIPPCIDVTSSKNQPMTPGDVTAILDVTGIMSANGSAGARYEFARTDGSRGTVARPAKVTEGRPVPSNADVVLQVSRWDRLKDHEGVMRGFVSRVLSDRDDAHLVLTGPDTDGVDDDPEGAETFASLHHSWGQLPTGEREHVHLVRLPMVDDDENRAMVNALQRRADVVLQKSIAEGFGLTVAEAMWKDRPIVASRVGGIQDQIVHGESGVLLDDPCDVEEFGRAVTQMLDDPDRAAAMGSAARQRVCDLFLPDHHFEREAIVLEGVLG